MKIKLYAVSNCSEIEKIKSFLIMNNLPFEEDVLDNKVYQELDKIAKYLKYSKESFLIIRYSHSIHGIHGFNEFALNQLLEHIADQLNLLATSCSANRQPIFVKPKDLIG